MRRGEVAPTGVLKEHCPQQNQVRWTPTRSRIVDNNTTYTRGICSPGTMSLRRACGLTTSCKGNLTILRRILHLDLAKGNPK
jgi:hypothetical protein